MSIIPAFEIGLWNASIFVLPSLLLTFIGTKLIKKRKMVSLSEYMNALSKKEKIILNISGALIFISYFYSIFLPLIIGSIWFYIGLVLYLLGLTIQIISWQNLATGSVDKPVTKGIYKFSRNPMYIGDFLLYTSIAIACLSWIFLMVSISIMITNYIAVRSEERECLSKYGDKYQDYMEKISRWIGKPKPRN